jgi:hypothetical protein
MPATLISFFFGVQGWELGIYVHKHINWGTGYYKNIIVY